MEALEEKLLRVTKTIEKQVDAAIEKIDNLDPNDLEQIRRNRINDMKKQEAKRKEWLANGHGVYEELPEEKLFFETTKKSENVVIHFYTNSSPRCAIVDKHLKILAPKHVETRFVKLNAEKCPFLATNLKVKTIPTLILIQNNVMVDKIIGFTQLGNRDDFTTEVLEWRIAQNNVINYEGDLSTPPDNQVIKSTKSSKTIRDGLYKRGDDDDLDAEEEGLQSIVGLQELRSTGDVKQNYLAAELTTEELAALGLDD